MTCPRGSNLRVLLSLLAIHVFPAVAGGAPCTDYSAQLRWLAGADEIGSAKAIEVHQGYAFVAGGRDGLHVFDVSGVPVRVATVPLSNAVDLDFDPVRQLVHVASSTEGLRLVDVADPTQPIVVGQLDSPLFFSAVQAVGNIAYLVKDGLVPELWVVDVSDETDPQWLGAAAAEGLSAPDVAVAGSLAFLANGSEGLQVVDTSTSTDPEVIATFEPGPPVLGVDVVGNHVVIALGDDGIQVVDFSNPVQADILGSLMLEAPAASVRVFGTHAFVGSEGNRIVDLSDPSAPRLVGEMGSWSSVEDGVKDGDRYFQIDLLGTLDIFDVSSVSSAQPLARLDILAGSVDHFSSSLVIVTQQPSEQVALVDVSNPSEPQTLDQISLPGSPWQVTVEGNLAYVSALGAGLQVLELLSDQTMTKRGFRSLANASDLAVQGGIACLAVPGVQDGEPDRILVVDVSDPDDPQFLGSENLSGSGANGVSMTNGLAVVAGNNVSIVDISNPTDPRVVSELTGIGAFDVETWDQLAYLGTRFGIQVLDLDKPSEPSLGSLVPAQFTVSGLDRDGNVLYGAGSIFGLMVVDVTTPLSPELVGNQYLERPIGLVSAESGSVIGVHWVQFTGIQTIAPPCGVTVPVVVDGFAIALGPDSVRVDWQSDLPGEEFRLEVLDDQGRRRTRFTSPSLRHYQAVVRRQDLSGPSVSFLLSIKDGSQWLEFDRRQVSLATAAFPPTLRTAPNPTRSETNIEFSIPRTGKVALAIFDLQGRLVRRLIAGDRYQGGAHSVPWNGADDRGTQVASGVYVVRLSSEGGVISGRLAVVR